MARYTGKKALNRRDFIKLAGASAGLALAGSGGVFAEDVEYVPSLCVPNEARVYRSTGPYRYEGVDVNHLTPGGLVNGDRNFRPEFYIYQAIDPSQVSVRVHPDRPSVGFNEYWPSGRFTVLSMPNRYGELRADFNVGSTMGGFYDSNRISTIRSPFDALSFGVQKGRVTLGLQPSSKVPLVEWSLDAIGSMGTGSVAVYVENGWPTIKTGRQVTSSHLRSAVPLALRFQRSGQEYWVYGDGSVKRSR